MPTAEATLLAACARAMREEMEPLLVSGWPDRGYFYVYRAGSVWSEPDIFQADTPQKCRAWIAQRAFAAGLRRLRDSEPTEAMLARTKVIETATVISIFRAMLGALLAGDEG